MLPKLVNYLQTSANGTLMSLLQDDYDEVDLPHMDCGIETMDGDDGDWGAADDDEDQGLPPMMGQEEGMRTPSDMMGTPRQQRGFGDGEAYEDMCRKYVEKYLVGVERFVQSSGLGARVNEWQSRLEPKLAVQSLSVSLCLSMCSLPLSVLAHVSFDPWVCLCARLFLCAPDHL